MKKYIVTPYVVDHAASLREKVTVVTDSPPKVVEADSSVKAALQHRPPLTTFWHIRQA